MACLKPRSVGLSIPEQLNLGCSGIDNLTFEKCKASKAKDKMELSVNQGKIFGTAINETVNSLLPAQSGQV